MRLVRIGHAVWDVLAIADDSGHSVWDELEGADPGDRGAERMRATLETDVPMNGPPVMNKSKCRYLGNDLFEFKEQGWRVLWFYDAGDPVLRRTIICSHSSPKVSKKEFQPEIARAKRTRRDYVKAKESRLLIVPKIQE